MWKFFIGEGIVEDPFDKEPGPWANPILEWLEDNPEPA